MKTIGIAIDSWKLAIFKRHLKINGFAFTQSPGLTPEMLLLSVKTESVGKLQRVVEAAQLECRSQ